MKKVLRNSTITEEGKLCTFTDYNYIKVFSSILRIDLTLKQ